MESIRRIGGILLGYISMSGLVVLSQVGIERAVGAEQLVQPGTTEPLLVWSLASLMFGLLAAGVGGAVCRKIAGCGKTVAVFAGITFVLGAAMAVLPFVVPPPEGTPKQPVWVAACLPFVGAIGILIGGKLAGGRTIRSAEPTRGGHS